MTDYIMFSNYWDEPLADFVSASVQTYIKRRARKPTEARLHPEDAATIEPMDGLKVVADKWTLPGHLLLGEVDDEQT